MLMRDSEIVASIKAGDSGGLAEAYDKYAGPLYEYCRFMLTDPGDAADAVQDTFVIAAARAAGLRDPERLRAWLYAVARGECLRITRGGPDPAGHEAMALSSGAAAAVTAHTAGLPGALRAHTLALATGQDPGAVAHRAAVLGRAGKFGMHGFPKPAHGRAAAPRPSPTPSPTPSPGAGRDHGHRHRHHHRGDGQ